MEELILEELGRKDYVPLNPADLMRHLQVELAGEEEFLAAIRALEREGRVARIKGNRYIVAREADLVAGKIRINRQGKGFLTPDDPALKEIVIPENATSTALHEDRVLVRREVRRARGETEERGAVVRVLERRRTQIVGTLQKTNQFLYVVPDDPRMPHDVYVPPARDVGRVPQIGEKVVVELREWQSRHTNPEGEIIEVLGHPDAEGVDMLSVLRQYDLPLHFPREVLDEANATGSEVNPNHFAGREDCRAHNVVTIDPDDAKDFDDAICLEQISRDQWRLWVHVADVSHYVKPGSPLDREAQKRGNSTYLVDRVIPMLPEALSNELCSLKPHVDRLTKCVEFLVGSDGRVLNAKFYPAVIHSKRRYTYREVLDILHRKPNGELEQMLHAANALAQKIRGRRFRAGSLDLDFPERKIRLDDRGKIVRIEKVENDISHQLIEEFMLLANEAVASELMGRRRPAVYRIHEEPSEKRLAEFTEELETHQIRVGDLRKRTEIQKLLARLNEMAIGPALKIGFLKSMMRARYSPEPLGHYGLAKPKYTHFTSPIRRYADLVVHRAMFGQEVPSRQAMHRIAEHISDTERNSADAERDSKDVKLFAFLQAQLDSGFPERYPALITDIRNFGFFVDVPDLAMSGMVRLSTIENDFYIYDNLRGHLVGRRSRRIIKLGDNVTVQIAKIDRFKKLVDFRLADMKKEPSRTKATGRPGRAEPPRERARGKRARDVEVSGGATERTASKRRRPDRERGESQPRDIFPRHANRHPTAPGESRRPGKARGPEQARRERGSSGASAEPAIKPYVKGGFRGQPRAPYTGDSKTSGGERSFRSSSGARPRFRTSQGGIGKPSKSGGGRRRQHRGKQR